MLLFSMLMAIAVPLDRAMWYFKSVSVVLGLMFVVSLSGIVTFLYE
jgi:hypothetical protein